MKKLGAGQHSIPVRDIQLLVAVSVLMLLLRMAYLQFLHPYGLAPDEAQYWSWLTHNDWSFLTKPPLTTWLMGVSTFVFGDSLVGVKFFALLSQVGTAVLGYLLAREVVDDRYKDAAGWWAFGLLTTLPLIAGGGLLMSPDAVLMPLWMAALLCVVRAFNAENEERALCWQRWILLGVLVGLGGLAKYSAALFFPLLGLYLLVWKRAWLFKPQVWVSGVIALAFQLPVLIWNMQNDWVGLVHVLWQADGGGDGRHSGLESFGEYVGGQALVLGPVVFGLVMYRVIGLTGYRVIGSAERFAWLVAIAILGMFGGLSFTAKVQANWPVLGAVTAVVVLAAWLARVEKKWVLWIGLFGILLNGVLTGILMDTYKARDVGIFPLKAKNDPTKDLRGWQDMGELLGLMLYKLDRPIVLSSRYQTLAPLMFHTIGNPEFAYMNAEGRRMNQYDLWPMPNMNERLVVYVNEQGVLPEKVKGMFGQCQPWHSLATETHGVKVRDLKLWLCWGMKAA